ncbi:hypothetical protein D3C85_1893970 [compost metagenome]
MRFRFFDNLLRQAVENDGQNNDGNPGLEADARLHLGNRPVDGSSDALRAYHGGDDDHG